MNFLFFAQFILSTVLVDYTQVKVRILSPCRRNEMATTTNMITLKDLDFIIPKYVSEDTIVYPLDMLENKVYKNTLLKESIQNDKMYTILDYETSLSVSDINSLFINTLVKDTNIKDIVVACRDYYSIEMIEDLYNVFSIIKNTTIHIIPSSLGYLIEESLSLESDYSTLVISLLGHKCTFSLYDIKYENKELKTINRSLCDTFNELSDGKIDSIIQKNVLQTLSKVVNNDKIILVPSERVLEQGMYSLDITSICEGIKSVLPFNDIPQYTHIESIAISTENRILYTNVEYNVDEIRIQIQEYYKEIRESLTNFKNEILAKMPEKCKINIISAYGIENAKEALEIEDITLVQSQYVVRGLEKYLKKNIKIENINIYKNNVHKLSKGIKLCEEIKLKNQFLNKLREIKNKGGIQKYFSNLCDITISDAELETEEFNKISFLLKKIHEMEIKNKQNSKYLNERSNKKSKLELCLEEILKKYEGNEIWNIGLVDKYNLIRKWYEENKDDMKVLGNTFDMKSDLLEGYVKVYQDKLIKEKEKVNKEALEEEGHEAKKEEEGHEAKKEDVDKEVVNGNSKEKMDNEYSEMKKEEVNKEVKEDANVDESKTSQNKEISEEKLKALRKKVRRMLAERKANEDKIKGEKEEDVKNGEKEL